MKENLVILVLSVVLIFVVIVPLAHTFAPATEALNKALTVD